MLHTPNLLLVGFQKCASSSIFDLLTQHPNIIGTKPKETFFFTDEEYENYNPKCNWNTTPQQFKNVFLEPKIGTEKEKYILEGSVCNFYQRTAFEYAKNRPDTKVIFVVRDPIERFVSAFRYAGTNGLNLKPGITIEEYYQLVKRGYIEKEMLRFGIEHGKYYRYIRQWEELIGENNVFITSIKQIKRDDVNEMGRLWAFLNLEPLFVKAPPYKNKTITTKFPKLHRYLVKSIGGFGLSNTMFYNWYKSLVSGNLKVNLPEWIKEELMKEYKEEYVNYKELF